MGPPPSEGTMKATGAVNAMAANGVSGLTPPGLDLEGSDPLQAREDSQLRGIAQPWRFK